MIVFLLNEPFLLPILVEECYLEFAKRNQLRNIRGIPYYLVEYYVKLDTSELLYHRNPINPHFIKY